MKGYSFILLSTIAVLWCYVDCVLEVWIDQTIGRDDPFCLRENASIPCFNVSYVASQLESGSNVTVFVAGEVKVNNFVQFSNLSHLSVIGEQTLNASVLHCISHNLTIVSCNGSNCYHSGFRFVNVKVLLISDLEIRGCGVQTNGSIIKETGVAIEHSKKVSLRKLKFTRSTGTSLFIHSTSGNLSLLSLAIESNDLFKKRVEPKQSFVRGVQIFLEKASICTIKNCTFFNISTQRYTMFNPSQVCNNDDGWLGFGLGGGLSVILFPSYNTLLIENSTLKSNFAPWGAGAYVKLAEGSVNNLINIESTQFVQCRAAYGGGGLYLGFAKSTLKTNNSISINNCTFIRNHAEYGAGTHVNAYYSDMNLENSVIFSYCSWKENSGGYSPAVDVSPSRFNLLGAGVLPTPVFKNCIFVQNMIVPTRKSRSQYVNSGIFVISRFTVIFENSLHFEINNSTSLLINSGRVMFRPYTQIKFINNRGSLGGGIALFGYSSLLFSDNCHFLFVNNSATVKGGAIYYSSIERREFFEGRDCFLSYKGNSSVNRRNVKFVFEGNTAVVSGSAIYASSFFPCFFAYLGTFKGYKIQEFFIEIGNFSFDRVYSLNNAKLGINVLSTTGYKFLLTEKSNSWKAIPGKAFSLPLTIRDELFQEQSKIEFFVDVNSTVPLQSPYTVNRSVTLFGTPGETINVVVSTLNRFRTVEFTADILLLSCPPGFYSNDNSCHCSADNRSELFLGLPKCDFDNLTAYISKGYWIGNYKNQLYTSLCPYKFCTGFETDSERLLPNSSADLSDFICEPSRTGPLCSQCKENYSVYYHSRLLRCDAIDKCSYGIVFFFTSELLPVLIMFSLIVVFDVSFSSGSKNCLIFYSQMIMILPLDWTKKVELGSGFNGFQLGYYLLYGIFNFEYFTAETLSFCLLKHATVMDVLAFKYITLLFAFALVVIVTICMNHCTCCFSICSLVKRRVTAKASVLHGLSACLIICYTECVRVSFIILQGASLHGAGETSGPTLALYGGMEYIRGKHIRYAIPAITALVTIGFIPPTLLLLYPSALKLLSFCGLSEHPIVLCVLGISRFDSLMPMFDVFQGDFKDSCRFFAGLYFLYRAAILISSLLSQRAFLNAILLQLVISLILFVHAAVQPYKLRSHNIFDSLLVGNLAIINGLSVLLFYMLQDTYYSSARIGLIITLMYFQLLLVYMPVIVLSLLHLKKLAVKLIMKYRRRGYADVPLIDNLSQRDEKVESE